MSSKRVAITRSRSNSVDSNAEKKQKTLKSERDGFNEAYLSLVDRIENDGENPEEVLVAAVFKGFNALKTESMAALDGVIEYAEEKREEVDADDSKLLIVDRLISDIADGPYPPSVEIEMPHVSASDEEIRFKGWDFPQVTTSKRLSVAYLNTFKNNVSHKNLKTIRDRLEKEEKEIQFRRACLEFTKSKCNSIVPKLVIDGIVGFLKKRRKDMKVDLKTRKMKEQEDVFHNVTRGYSQSIYSDED